ncbi:MAG: outer membrane protein transport protein [Pseudomonadota bacterium]
MKLQRQLGLGAVSAAILASMTTAALAGGFALREQSAYYQGLSFAGAASGSSLSSMFWNPAALGTVGPGMTSEGTFGFIIPQTEVTTSAPVTTKETDISVDAFIPASYGAYRINDRVSLGFSVNGPFGLATKFGLDSPLRTGLGMVPGGAAGTSEVFSINVAPTVAFNVTDWLTLGVGVQGQYLSVRYTDAQLNVPLGVSTLEVDDIGFGFTAGVLLTPFDGTSIGVGFRSRIEHDLEGDLFTQNPFIPRVDAQAELVTPDTITVGISQRVTDTFTLLAGFEWANWSNLDIVTVTGFPGNPRDIPFKYQDGWFLSVGGEYQATDHLSVRAGVAYEESPITDAHRTYRLPDNNRWWFSAGASYTPLENVRLDFGYSYIRPDETPVNAGLSFGGTGPDSNLVWQGEAEADVHILTVGFKVELEDGLAGLFGH